MSVHISWEAKINNGFYIAKENTFCLKKKFLHLPYVWMQKTKTTT